MSDTLDRLREVFYDAFDDDELAINPETTAYDIEDWDSLMQVTLVVNSEQAFDLKFTTAEVRRLKNVGEFVELIDRKLAEKQG